MNAIAQRPTRRQRQEAWIDWLLAGPWTLVDGGRTVAFGLKGVYILVDVPQLDSDPWHCYFRACRGSATCDHIAAAQRILVRTIANEGASNR